MRILVVDDDDYARENIKQVAAQLGCTIVGETSGGFEAACLSHYLKPDVILMDLDPPAMNGLEATSFCIAPVIILTSLTLSEITGSLREIGASACLTKPLTAQSLERALAVAQ
ncbi:MAG: response regulator [Anaerolineaceae bacterium]|nr:response regulator [Anaerolineaceae bacterium]MCB9099328.1 response regulator [Anaerolineales bacterium]